MVLDPRVRERNERGICGCFCVSYSQRLKVFAWAGLVQKLSPGISIKRCDIFARKHGQCDAF
jgi:hypothetical protein